MPNHNSFAERHQASSESFEDECFFPNPSVHFFAQSYVEYFFDIALRLDSPFATTNICCTLTLTGSSILYLLLILDFGFGLFFLKSDNFDYTLASQRWRARYWYPINSLGLP